MLTYFGKYKALIISSLLIAYLTGTFHGPVLEGLHRLSHMVENAGTSGEAPHIHPHPHEGSSHYFAFQHDHQHSTLNVLNSLLNLFADDHTPNQDEKKDIKKKNPELLNPIHPIAFLNFPSSTQPVFSNHALFSIFPSIPSPPPKVLLTNLC